MKKILKMNLTLLVLMVLSSGCLFYENAQINYFDTNGLPHDKIDINALIFYKQFRNLTPVGVNFLYTNNQGMLEIDRLNCWIQNPEVMVQREFISTINATSNLENSDSISKVDVYATLFAFTINKDTKNCQVGIKILLKSNKNNTFNDFEKQYIETVAFENNNPQNYTVALASAIDKIIAQVANDIKNITKNN